MCDSNDLLYPFMYSQQSVYIMLVLL